MLVELVVQPNCNWLRQQNIFKLFNKSSEAIMLKKTRDTRRLGLSSLFMTIIAMYMASCAMFFRPLKRGIFCGSLSASHGDKSLRKGSALKGKNLLPCKRRNLSNTKLC